MAANRCKADSVQKLIEAQVADFDSAVAALQARFNDKVDKLQGGDELLPGVMKMVKVFVAVKHGHSLAIKWGPLVAKV